MRHVILSLLLLFSPFLLAQSCVSENSLDKLLGSWESKNGDKIINESWSQVSEYTFEGSGQTLLKGLIKSSESLRIVEMSGALFYIAKVSHNLLPVAFELVECSENSLIFENNSHDFPKKIAYKFVEDKQMLVTVSDGKSEGFSINFTRKKH